MAALRALRQAIANFVADNCLTLAASLAYYTLFAMPPLLFLVFAIVTTGMSFAYDTDVAERQSVELIERQATELTGNSEAAKEISLVLENSRKHGDWGWSWKSLLGLAGVLLGATGILTALQSSLNTVWKTPADPQRAKFHFLWKRLLSLTMILGFGLLLLISFFLQWILRFADDWFGNQLALSSFVVHSIDQLLGIAFSWVIFATVFRYMPDMHVPWKYAALGGLFTVILFMLGRALLSVYFTYSDPAKELGSATGSLVAILLWVYYSSIILLLGAEFTAALQGHRDRAQELPKLDT